MACISADQVLLEEIVAHPSQTMKSRVRDVLAKLKAVPKAVAEEPPSDAELFSKYWESIKQAPVSLPAGTTGIETRNEVWAKYERAYVSISF
jgi:hypothetical protein